MARSVSGGAAGVLRAETMPEMLSVLSLPICRAIRDPKAPPHGNQQFSSKMTIFQQIVRSRLRRASRPQIRAQLPCDEAGHGLFLEDQSRMDEAEAAYRKALELDPGGALYWNNCGDDLQNSNNESVGNAEMAVNSHDNRFLGPARRPPRGAGPSGRGGGGVPAVAGVGIGGRPRWTRGSP